MWHAKSSPATRRTLSFLLVIILAILHSSGCVGAVGDANDGASLTATPSTVSFGDATTGTTSSRSVTLTNHSPAAVSVEKVSMSGAGFGVSGIPVGLTLAPGDAAAMTITFAPSSAGKV